MVAAVALLALSVFAFASSVFFLLLALLLVHDKHARRASLEAGALGDP